SSRRPIALEPMPANERRIQMTNVSGIPLEPGCRTLLGGWSEEDGVFAFWDPRRHTRFSRKSPSLQVTSDTLQTANHVGIATYHRPTKLGIEVVVAVSPDSLLWYVQQGLPLHNSERDSASVVKLADATTEEERSFLDESEDEIQAARRYDLVETMRAYRDAKFRPAVLRAYRYKCAVCKCDLKLVDAAHIVPVSYGQSTDEVTNGLALCRLHHGAFDNALLGVRSDYSVITNPEAEARLSELRLAMALPEFKSRLPDTIALPTSLEMRPAPENLRLGLEVRRWPRTLIA
ncbi:MAG: HNH endonuclease, partial [Phycisphaerae bacterium]